MKKKDFNILEIRGLEGSSPARERHAGFKEQIALFPNFKIKYNITGNWLRSESFRNTLNFKDIQDVQVVFAHNDEMAIGAYNACKQLKLDTKNMIFVGVDALQSKEGGVQAVIDHKITATLLYPTGGAMAIDVAEKILQKKKYNKEYLLNTALIDSSNAQILKLQYIQINDYLKKIETQYTKLQLLDSKYNNQQTLLYISVILMGIAFFLAILLYFAYQHAKQLLLELESKNIKITQQREVLSQQREQLVEMNNKIEEVTAQKLRFFTNISHELRTPLSLLISPLEKIFEINTDNRINRELLVIKNNTERLLRLISQLLDFRKIEDGQMKLYIRKINIISLLKNTTAAFNFQAQVKEINYNLILVDESIDIYCDEDKIEKVFF